jgi:hypothetical protein
MWLAETFQVFGRKDLAAHLRQSILPLKKFRPHLTFRFYEYYTVVPYHEGFTGQVQRCLERAFELCR